MSTLATLASKAAQGRPVAKGPLSGDICWELSIHSTPVSAILSLQSHGNSVDQPGPLGIGSLAQGFTWSQVSTSSLNTWPCVQAVDLSPFLLSGTFTVGVWGAVWARMCGMVPISGSSGYGTLAGYSGNTPYLGQQRGRYVRPQECLGCWVACRSHNWGLRVHVLVEDWKRGIPQIDW